MICSSYKKSFDGNQELAAGQQEMIVRCSSYSVVSQHKLKRLYLGISQAQRKDHYRQKTICFKPWDFSGAKKRSYLVKNNLFQNKFFFLLDMMHPIIPGANAKLQRDSKTNNTQPCVKTDEVLHSIVTLTHSLSHFHDIATLPPKGQSSCNKGKISAQPHTIVKQSSKPNLLLSSLFHLAKNCMYDKIWGCCAEIMPISNLKRKKRKKERDF